MNELNALSKIKLVASVLFTKGTSISTLFSYGGNAPGLTDTTLLKAYSKLPWLKAAFGKVADGVASGTWYIESATDKVTKKYISVPSLQHGSYESRKAVRRIMAEKVILEKTVSHPMLDLMVVPNPFITGHGLIKLTQLHLEITGEALWWIELKNGRPIRIWPIPPNWIAKRPTRNGNDYFELSVDGMPERLGVEEVIWFREPDPADPYERTVGSAEPIADELSADEYAAKHVKAWFHNHARPDLIISGTGLDKDESDRAEERWLQKLRGYLKVGRPHFVGADIKVQEIGQSFVSMQLVELRKFQRDIVIQSLGLPPEIMGIIESSNRSTINAASYVFSKWVLIPRFDVIRQTLQTQFIPMFDSKSILEYVSPVEEDREFRLDVMKAAPYSFTIDDWRAVVGDDPMPNGQGQVIVIPNASSLAEADKILEWESPYTQQSQEGKGGTNE